MLLQKKIIGLKCSKCCMVTSLWGIIMLLILGAAYKLHSPALFDDIKLNIADPLEYMNRTHVFNAYNEAGNNCFIAAGMYVIVLFFSMWQWRVNETPHLHAYVLT